MILIDAMKDYKTNKGTSRDAFCQSVYDIVKEIPAGKVTTYGEIARLLGQSQAARRVGYALKHLPETVVLPCHRVVNAAGRLVPGWDEQRQLLLAEGVCFRKNGNIDLGVCLWRYEEEETWILNRR